MFEKLAYNIGDQIVELLFGHVSGFYSYNSLFLGVILYLIEKVKRISEKTLKGN